MKLLNNFTNKSKTAVISFFLLLLLIFIVLLTVEKNKTDYVDETRAKDDSSSHTGLVDSSNEESPYSFENRLDMTEEEKSNYLTVCKMIAKQYKCIFDSSEKIESPYYKNDEKLISQEAINKIEDLLISLKYPVINSDSVYPAYLEHSEGFHEFWKGVNQNKDSETEIISISENGGIYYRKLCFYGGKAYSISITTKWNKNGTLELFEATKREIFFWSMTKNKDFYYQDLRLDKHWEASKFLRLHPVDRKLYDLNLKYIKPIGYHNVNIFLLEWEQNNFGNLCFNDLFGGLYYADNNKQVYEQDFTRKKEPFFYCEIPAQLFEKTVWKHFDISIDEFRRKTLYDKENNIYPWQDIDTDNVIYYPNVYTDIIECDEMDDIIKLKISVICPDYHSDCVLTHEVTIRELPDGGWQYLSNHIIARDNVKQPSPQARIEAQRFSIDNK